MKPVVTASLNQQAYFFEQDAFMRLEDYLHDANRVLAHNPDREEILRDLEQAIAERCPARARTASAVITLAELEPILTEMGPVTDPSSAQSQEHSREPGKDSADAEHTTHTGPADTAHTHRQHRAEYVRPPLEQISEGALLSGVCMGLSRYFGIEVSLIRIAMVVLTLISAGLAIGLYLFLMFLLPYAPVDLDGTPIRRWPRKIRGWVERARARLSGALR
ncbi:MAG: PspC domain-containing protein [Steroidobacteraceae bacterium]|jgi:phage shock protein C|nr:PspC domain-containing protein [Gammaproteobacteria bacterium]